MKNTLEQITCRMPKDSSSLFYFLLESRDNLCFYSTLPFEKGQGFRDVIVHVTPDLLPEFKNALKQINQNIDYQVLESSFTLD